MRQLRFFALLRESFFGNKNKIYALSVINFTFFIFLYVFIDFYK